MPKEFRKKLNLHEGDEVILYITEDGIIIKPKIIHLGML
ncbi:MAG: AbrB/MazE/SpoVT family DNA-binding domain-containing protein [Promethearchaeota archaeon]